MSAADLARAMKEGCVLDKNGRQAHDLVDILHETLPNTSARSISRHLGYWKGRVVDGRELYREKDWDRNVYVFGVRKVK